MTVSDRPRGAACRWLLSAVLIAGLFAMAPAPLTAGGVRPAPESVELARRQFEAGRYADVVATLAAAPALDSDALFWLGRAQFELRDYPAAIQALERRVVLAPDDSESHRWLGRAYGEEADRQRSWSLARKVREHFETAVRLSPKSVAARRDLLQFYLDAPWLLGGSDDNARKEVAAIDAIDAVAGHLARAAYASHHGDVTVATAEYEAALDARPAAASAYFEAAEFFERRRDAAGLRAAVEGAASAAASDPQLLYFRAVLETLTGGSLSDAESLLKAYLATPPRSDRPSFASAHEWLGRVDERAGRAAEAIAEYRAALALEPTRKGASEALKRLGAKQRP